MCTQHKRRRIKSVSDDEDDEHVADMEMIENEIFGDDDDAGSVVHQAADVGGATLPPTEFDLEQSDEESGSESITVLVDVVVSYAGMADCVGRVFSRVCLSAL